MNPTTTPTLVVHGGAGGPRDHDDGCERACEVAFPLLQMGKSALSAVIEATVVLEDDPRLNAGTGSNYRLDGTTIEMDAALMDSTGRFGAVAAIQRVRNPIRVAQEVMGTPHLLLAGEGATRFARARGVRDFLPRSERADARYAKVKEFLAGKEGPPDAQWWKKVDLESLWNFPTELRDILGPSDTVGAVARDEKGGFAVALSTGGTSMMLLGRVGDTPIIGSGLFAGPAGAVAATGDGEEIMRSVLAKWVYDRIEAGVPLQAALDDGVARIPDRFIVGLIGVSRDAVGVSDNRTMPRAMR